MSDSSTSAEAPVSSNARGIAPPRRQATPLPQRIVAGARSAPWFSRLPEAVQADVIARFTVRAATDGVTIFTRTDPADSIVVVLEGIVRVSSVSREGRETVLDFYGPGAWIGEVATLAEQPRQYDAQAHGNALFASLGSADLETLLKKHFSLSRALLKLEAERLLTVLSALLVYSALTIEQRLAARLLLLAQHHGTATARGVELGLDLSHETLARLVGSTRQRINHILNGWQRAKMVDHHYGRIVLVEIGQLRALATH